MGSILIANECVGGGQKEEKRRMGYKVGFGRKPLIEKIGIFWISFWPERDGNTNRRFCCSYDSPWKGNIQTLPKFLPFIKLQVGSGTNISFWNEYWIVRSPLRVKFPRPLSLTLRKTCPVSTFFSFPENWKFHFRRD